MLAIIPAKGTSLRLAGKNLRPLGGQPMFYWTVKAAIDSGLFSRIVVSSDEEEILSTAKGMGVYGLRRPQRLAEGHVPVAQVCRHVLDELAKANRIYEKFCLLLPTNPLRTAEDIRAGWAIINGLRPQPDFVVSISPHRSNAHFALRRLELEAKVEERVFASPTMTPLLPGFNLDSDARSAQPTYYIDGAVYWARVKAFRKCGQIGSQCPGTAFFQIPEARAHNVDMVLDFLLAEKLFELRKAGVL